MPLIPEANIQFSNPQLDSNQSHARQWPLSQKGYEAGKSHSPRLASIPLSVPRCSGLVRPGLPGAGLGKIQGKIAETHDKTLRLNSTNTNRELRLLASAFSSFGAPC